MRIVPPLCPFFESYYFVFLCVLHSTPVFLDIFIIFYSPTIDSYIFVLILCIFKIFEHCNQKDFFIFLYFLSSTTFYLSPIDFHIFCGHIGHFCELFEPFYQKNVFYFLLIFYFFEFFNLQMIFYSSPIDY